MIIGCRHIFEIFLVYTALSSVAVGLPPTRPREHGIGIEDSITISTLDGRKNRKEILYLTLDACGGKNGSEPDIKLIKYLKRNKIKATLFVSCKFLQNGKNRKLIKKLARSKNFSIQNHGKNHLPALLSGKTIYGLRGTTSKNTLVEEIEQCGKMIAELTGGRPDWYRSGTAHYDEGALKVINSLGYRVAGFKITLDEGATLTSDAVRERALSAKDGDILLAHMNAPRSGTRDGLIEATKTLRKKRKIKFELLPSQLSPAKPNYRIICGCCTRTRT
ncbi:MAG: polysaccharide deacetylase family protein [Rickettsiales bacterium]|nr:polysaccharide deacetylase family protein [Rickettsiales bacterium]